MYWQVPKLCGERFGLLLVVGKGEVREERSGRRMSWFPCRCECGEFLWVRSQSLLTGTTRSCGCLRAEAAKVARSARSVAAEKKAKASEEKSRLARIAKYASWGIKVVGRVETTEAVLSEEAERSR